jgi:hypothetical protein
LEQVLDLRAPLADALPIHGLKSRLSGNRSR